MAFTSGDTNINSPMYFLAADDPISGAGGIFAYGPGGTQSPFGTVSVSNPLGLAIDATGNVYVGANGGLSIEELSPTGSTIEKTITGTHAQSLAVDSAGNLYVADNTTANIIEYLIGGGSRTYSSAPVDGALGSNMYGMTFDGAGDLFVTFRDTSSTGGIDEITPDGHLSLFYASSIGVPVGLAYDGESGDLYMSYATSANGIGGGIEAFSDGSGGTLSAATATNFQTFTTGSFYAIAYLAPEPGTTLMFAGGLLAIALFRLRRSRKSVA